MEGNCFHTLLSYLITNRVPLLSFAPETATPALKAALIAALSTLRNL